MVVQVALALPAETHRLVPVSVVQVVLVALQVQEVQVIRVDLLQTMLTF